MFKDIVTFIVMILFVFAVVGGVIYFSSHSIKKEVVVQEIEKIGYTDVVVEKEIRTLAFLRKTRSNAVFIVKANDCKGWLASLEASVYWPGRDVYIRLLDE
jgi:hypothetical protein